jgi:hypothetical protein
MKDRSASSEPEHEHHGLQDECPLVIGEIKVLRVFPQQVPHYVDYEKEGE